MTASSRISSNPTTAAELLVQCDLSQAMAGRAPGLRAAADEELLPFRPASFDLVVSCLTLHWVNDLPGSLVQARQALKPDGLFLAVMLGGGTLRELRSALLAADTELSGGAGPRISPFADVRDAGDLLSRAGFALPVADTSILTVSYADPVEAARAISGGWGNPMRSRPGSGHSPAAKFFRAPPSCTGRCTETRRAGCRRPSR